MYKATFQFLAAALDFSLKSEILVNVSTWDYNSLFVD